MSAQTVFASADGICRIAAAMALLGCSRCLRPAAAPAATLGRRPTPVAITDGADGHRHLSEPQHPATAGSAKQQSPTEETEAKLAQLKGGAAVRSSARRRRHRRRSGIPASRSRSSLAEDPWRRYAEADRESALAIPPRLLDAISVYDRVADATRVSLPNMSYNALRDLTWKNFTKSAGLPPYVFEQVNRLKASARARGADIIDLGMGNPDLPTPKAIVDKLCEVVRDPRTHRYSSSRGIPGLRRAQAAYYAAPLRREAQPGHAGRRDARLQGRLRQHGAGDHRAGRRGPLPEPDLSDPRLRLHHVGRRHPLAAGRARRRLHPGARARRSAIRSRSRWR